MKQITFLLLAVALLLLGTCGNSDNTKPDADDPIDWVIVANNSSKALANSFWNVGEKYFNYGSDGKLDFHYWPQAHALDVLVDAYLRTGDDFYKNYFHQWFEGVRIKNHNTFYNEYYDDMEWIALALLRTYQATKESKYKDAVFEIWEYIKVGWNDNAGGGITWKKGQEWSKNACSNGPACILAARLYREFGDEDYKQWALKIYNWEKATLFNNTTGAVYDNINSQTGRVNERVYSYNPGTFIGAAVELYKILGERAYLIDATLAADYVISSLVDESILKSEGTGDGGLFKGIFIRYFTELIQQDRLDAIVQKRYLQFLNLNVETLWNSGTLRSAYFFGPNWRVAPENSTGLTEQLSGCMLMEAAARLIKN